MNDRGVSAVMGIVVMVAIVVVLAAVVGAYAVTFGEATQPAAPQAAFHTQYDTNDGVGEALTITLQAGATLDTAKLSLVLDEAQAVDGTGATAPAHPSGHTIANQVGSEWTATESVDVDASSTTVSGSEHLDLTGATVRIVWLPEPNPDSTKVLLEWNAPR